MTLVDYRIDKNLYANIYSELNITGTIFLAYRDLPQIINKYILDKKTLDYGCGAGKSTMFLKSLGLEVDGVDTNEEMIKSALVNDFTGTYKVIDSCEIPSIDQSYDLVFASWVFMEVSSKKAMAQIMQEIYRVLKPGGIFITLVCSEDCYNNDWTTTNTKFPENDNLQSGDKVKVYFKDIDLTILDYYWKDKDYKEVFAKSDLQLIASYNPMGRENDGYQWAKEKELSPYTIYILKK
jgi:ubiquinone/menaquinone biosynthesis C-methylase UbiE